VPQSTHALPLLSTLVVLGLAAGCGGDEGSGATGADFKGGREIEFRGVALVIEGVPDDQTELRAALKPPGPPTGWTPNLDAEFFVRAPKQSVDQPAKLIFTIDADRFDEETRGQVDQLLAFSPRALLLGPCEGSGGRAVPDPCIASQEFLANGDGRVVVLTSNPASG
jgi:hypothetical protein